MITVRFPSGVAVQYNSMNAQKWSSDGRQLLFATSEARDACKGWKVSVPADCIVEFVAPCRVYNPTATDSDKVQASIESLSKEVRRLTRKLAKLEAR